MKKFIFTHVPKTAGTTIRNLFKNKVPISEIPTFRDEHENEDFASYLKCGKINHNFFLGHIDYSLADILGPDYLKFCILRNPIDRYISTLKHAIRDNSFLKDMNLDNDISHQSINFLAANAEFIKINSNSATRFIATNPKAEALIKGDLAYAEYHLEYQNDVESAITNLNSYHFVGLQEEMNKSVSGICSIVGTTIPPLIPFDNVAGNIHEEISHDTYRIAKEINSNDIRLYQHAIHLFNNYKIPNELDLIPSISGDAVLDLGDSFSCSGWHPPERVGTSNPPVYQRWASKKQDFQIAIKKSGTYRFEFLYADNELIKDQSLSILVNDQPVKFIISESIECKLIQFEITSDAGMCKLKIICTKSVIPSNVLAESKDMRDLSILLKKIAIISI
ncbi:sulfotransferase family 2 domain-containing protein [Polynucleobacter alcilacus]|uniref:sulfotransferase family 2 domain-containing protein n=1 Tax=Polynucleobacter alcilacus TaxID=1819739 RepID=UPI001C0B6D03|nr:sulfotransferase family 2 domain-containing protein [Polynucleobacter alcilacus]MBU3568573.1 sulfotransferase family 2 domain-containing protein [Polynucleobacter alcilacus]